MTAAELVPQHPYGERIEAMHQCPDCAGRVRIFCVTCAGAGLVSSLRLEIWERRQWEGVRV